MIASSKEDTPDAGTKPQIAVRPRQFRERLAGPFTFWPVPRPLQSLRNPSPLRSLVSSRRIAVQGEAHA